MIDINCDMGESFGTYSLGMDEEVMEHITSANIACGWHAGDPMVMERTVGLAKRHGVAVGAHPGYPDLMGFGRREMALAYGEVRNYVAYQIGALMAFTKIAKVPLQHVKAHGALYLTSVENEDVAKAVAEAVALIDPGLIFVGLAGEKGQKMKKAAESFGLRVALEAFPDRNYTPEGTLVPRKRPDAVLHDPELVAERAVLMAKEGKIRAVDGTIIHIEVHTLCVHGDNPEALALVKKIRESIIGEGVQVKPMKEILK
jgi:UPF0271 protein